MDEKVQSEDHELTAQSQPSILNVPEQNQDNNVAIQSEAAERSRPSSLTKAHRQAIESADGPEDDCIISDQQPFQRRAKHGVFERDTKVAENPNDRNVSINQETEQLKKAATLLYAVDAKPRRSPRLNKRPMSLMERGATNESPMKEGEGVMITNQEFPKTSSAEMGELDEQEESEKQQIIDEQKEKDEQKARNQKAEQEVDFTQTCETITLSDAASLDDSGTDLLTPYETIEPETLNSNTISNSRKSGHHTNDILATKPAYIEAVDQDTRKEVSTGQDVTSQYIMNEEPMKQGTTSNNIEHPSINIQETKQISPTNLQPNSDNRELDIQLEDIVEGVATHLYDSNALYEFSQPLHLNQDIRSENCSSLDDPEDDSEIPTGVLRLDVNMDSTNDNHVDKGHISNYKYNEKCKEIGHKDSTIGNSIGGKPIDEPIINEDKDILRQYRFETNSTSTDETEFMDMTVQRSPDRYKKNEFMRNPDSTLERATPQAKETGKRTRGGDIVEYRPTKRRKGDNETDLGGSEKEEDEVADRVDKHAGENAHMENSTQSILIPSEHTNKIECSVNPNDISDNNQFHGSLIQNPINAVKDNNIDIEMTGALTEAIVSPGSESCERSKLQNHDRQLVTQESKGVTELIIASRKSNRASLYSAQSALIKRANAVGKRGQQGYNGQQIIIHPEFSLDQEVVGRERCQIADTRALPPSIGCITKPDTDAIVLDKSLVQPRRTFEVEEMAATTYDPSAFESDYIEVSPLMGTPYAEVLREQTIELQHLRSVCAKIQSSIDLATSSTDFDVQGFQASMERQISAVDMTIKIVKDGMRGCGVVAKFDDCHLASEAGFQTFNSVLQVAFVDLQKQISVQPHNAVRVGEKRTLAIKSRSSDTRLKQYSPRKYLRISSMRPQNNALVPSNTDARHRGELLVPSGPNEYLRKSLKPNPIKGERQKHKNLSQRIAAIGEETANQIIECIEAPGHEEEYYLRLLSLVQDGQVLPDLLPESANAILSAFFKAPKVDLGATVDLGSVNEVLIQHWFRLLSPWRQSLFCQPIQHQWENMPNIGTPDFIGEFGALLIRFRETIRSEIGDMLDYEYYCLKIAISQKIIGDKDFVIAKLKGEIKERDQNITESVGKIQEMNKNIVESQRQVTEVTKEMMELREQNEKYNNNVVELERKIEEKNDESKIVELERKIEEKNDEIVELRGKLEGKNDESKIVELERKIQKKNDESKIVELERKIEEKNDEIVELSGKLEGKNDEIKIADLERKIQKKNDQIVELSEKLEGKNDESKIVELEGRFEEEKRNNLESQGQIKEISQSLVKLKGQVKENSQDIVELQSKIEKNDHKIVDLEGRIFQSPLAHPETQGPLDGNTDVLVSDRKKSVTYPPIARSKPWETKQQPCISTDVPLDEAAQSGGISGNNPQTENSYNEATNLVNVSSRMGPSSKDKDAPFQGTPGRSRQSDASVYKASSRERPTSTHKSAQFSSLPVRNTNMNASANEASHNRTSIRNYVAQKSTVSENAAGRSMPGPHVRLLPQRNTPQRNVSQGNASQRNAIQGRTTHKYVSRSSATQTEIPSGGFCLGSGNTGTGVKDVSKKEAAPSSPHSIHVTIVSSQAGIPQTRTDYGPQQDAAHRSVYRAMKPASCRQTPDNDECRDTTEDILRSPFSPDCRQDSKFYGQRQAPGPNDRQRSYPTAIFREERPWISGSEGGEVEDWQSCNESPPTRHCSPSGSLNYRSYVTPSQQLQQLSQDIAQVTRQISSALAQAMLGNTMHHPNLTKADVVTNSELKQLNTAVINGLRNLVSKHTAERESEHIKLRQGMMKKLRKLRSTVARKLTNLRRCEQEVDMFLSIVSSVERKKMGRMGLEGLIYTLKGYVPAQQKRSISSKCLTAVLHCVERYQKRQFAQSYYEEILSRIRLRFDQAWDSFGDAKWPSHTEFLDLIDMRAPDNFQEYLIGLVGEDFPEPIELKRRAAAGVAKTIFSILRFCEAYNHHESRSRASRGYNQLGV